MALPLGRLRFLYVGSFDYDADLRMLRDQLGAEKVWEFHDFGARVAAYRTNHGPLHLVADHRPAPSVLPVYEVDDLEATVKDWKAKGLEAKECPFGIPNGDCYLYEDPSGNAFAIFEDIRPNAMEEAYPDAQNEHAVRE